MGQSRAEILARLHACTCTTLNTLIPVHAQEGHVQVHEQSLLQFLILSSNILLPAQYRDRVPVHKTQLLFSAIMVKVVFSASFWCLSVCLPVWMGVLPLAKG